MTFSKLLYRCFKHRWERALAVLSLLIGALALLIGWLGISRATLTTEQLPYLASGGLLGLFALGLGATLWLSADLHDEFGALLRINRLSPGSEPDAVGCAGHEDAGHSDDEQGVLIRGRPRPADRPPRTRHPAARRALLRARRGGDGPLRPDSAGSRTGPRSRHPAGRARHGPRYGPLALADVVYVLARGRMVFAGQVAEAHDTDILAHYLGAATG